MRFPCGPLAFSSTIPHVITENRSAGGSVGLAEAISRQVEHLERHQRRGILTTADVANAIGPRWFLPFEIIAWQRPQAPTVATLVDGPNCGMLDKRKRSTLNIVDSMADRLLFRHVGAAPARGGIRQPAPGIRPGSVRVLWFRLRSDASKRSSFRRYPNERTARNRETGDGNRRLPRPTGPPLRARSPTPGLPVKTGAA
jgi:hypothetical protein